MKALFKILLSLLFLLPGIYLSAQDSIVATADSSMAAVSSTATATVAPALDSGDTAWMIVAAAFVLMMTIPGLALFYGGLVRRKNVINILMQCFIITGLITVEW
ncbi:MAG TPA: ammonia channel protein, partial [Bacteroidales bacterium]|nr:ammonia channel protein [Bacteroidales bacterium]